MTDDDRCFVVTWRDPSEGGITTLRARRVGDSELGLGFVAVSDFVFGEGSVILDPKQEALERRFKSVRKLHLHIHTILSVEEVGLDNEGLRFTNDRSNLVLLPLQRPGDDAPSR